MKPELRPFTCSYTEGLPELLNSLGCTLAISTYQAGKVIFISATDKKSLIQLPRSFKKPMGIAIRDQQLAIATRNEVVILANAPGLAATFPKQPNTYDALYLPRSIYYTGELDIHDLAFTDSGMIGVTTRFSCISKINEQFSFTPIWKPKFISSLQPNDQCHLNGMALDQVGIKYITALGQTDSGGGWRTNKAKGGILMDAQEQEIILDGLPMPHSPRIYGGKLYILLSASGELIQVDVQSQKYDVVQKLNGFVRGMDKIGDYVFIGLSKLRTTSKTFGDLPIASKSIFCGVAVIQLSTGRLVGHIKYENSVEEIYDVRVLPNVRRPGVLNHYQEDHLMAITLPQGNYWTAPNPQDTNE
ncbi:MAG: TIGR03032 family protein [Cyclobacteriaceae bacterium]|jgi:uncharacterized protein (TIGR03032 family)|nr:TIGR03032 family protein [Cyclobacteriaceae bacterium]